MAATVIGNNLSTRVERKDSKRKTRTISGNTATYRYTQAVGTAVSESIGDEDPADSTIILRSINFDPNPGGGYETVELVYEPPNPPTGPTPPVGTITYEADANAIEIPIQQHPDYDEAASKTDKNGVFIPVVAGEEMPGVESYLVPQPTFLRVEILSSFTFTEAAIISGVGTRCAPTGLGSPTTDAWLKTRLSIRKNGNVVEKSETWQFASRGWNAKLYP